MEGVHHRISTLRCFIIIIFSGHTENTSLKLINVEMFMSYNQKVQSSKENVQ